MFCNAHIPKYIFADEADTDTNKINAVLEQSGLKAKIDSYEKGVHTNLLKIFDKEGIDLSGGENRGLLWQEPCIKGKGCDFR